MAVSVAVCEIFTGRTDRRTDRIAISISRDKNYIYNVFVMQNLEDLGAKGRGHGSKFLVENVIFGIADPDLPIHYATFIGLQ